MKVFLPWLILGVATIVEKVKGLSLIITELADPNDGISLGRYVELYSSDAAGKTITDELYLLRWTNGNSFPTTSSAFRLTGLTIGMDGFLVFCNDICFNTVYGDKCDSILGIGGPADSNGDDQIAIVRGNLSSYTIMDVFGVPGEDGTGTAHDFGSSQAERKGNVVAAKPAWNASDWSITSAGVAGMTPREWAGAMTTVSSGVSASPSPAQAAFSLIITELADPNDDFNGARYVELYSSDAAGKTITDELYLLRWTNGNTFPTQASAFRLTGLEVGLDGFLILCSSIYFETAYGDKCDSVLGIGGPADSDGDDQIAIVLGNPSCYTIVDIFGVPGEDGTGTAHDFTGSQAERKREAVIANSTWNEADWSITPAGVADMNPRQWAGAIATTPCAKKGLRMACSKDIDCCSGLCTGNQENKKKCRFCARKKEMCTNTAECCQSPSGRYCDPILNRCLKCPKSGCMDMIS